MRRLRFYVRDLFNFAIFGRKAPRSAQLIFVDPKKVNHVINSKLGRRQTGMVMDGDWDEAVTAFTQSAKYEICNKRFTLGHSWETAGAYKLIHQLMKEEGGKIDGCRTRSDVIQRYEDLDRIYEFALQEGRLRTRKEIRKNNFRELGGICIHINRYGDPIFGGGGWHRLAIAKSAGLALIPAQVGIIHKKALPIWKDSVLFSPGRPLLAEGITDARGGNTSRTE